MKPISSRSHSEWTLKYRICWCYIDTGLCKGVWSIFWPLPSFWGHAELILSWASSQGPARWDENPARTQLTPTLYWCGLIPLSPLKDLTKSEACAVSHHYDFVKQFIWWWVWWVIFFLLWSSSQQLWACFLGSPSWGGCAQIQFFLMQAIRLWICETFCETSVTSPLVTQSRSWVWKRQDSFCWPLCPHDLAAISCARLRGLQSPECQSAMWVCACGHNWVVRPMWSPWGRAGRRKVVGFFQQVSMGREGTPGQPLRYSQKESVSSCCSSIVEILCYCFREYLLCSFFKIS